MVYLCPINYGMINILIIVLLSLVLASVWMVYFRLKKKLNVILDKIEVTNELLVMPNIDGKGEIDMNL